MFWRPGLPLVALIVGAAAASAQENNFTRTGSGARAAGMANAFIAVSDDGTAASWNPAGLGQLRKPELSVVSTTLGQTLRVQGFRTRDDLSAFTNESASYQNTYLDFASLALPATLWKKPVTFQGAWRRFYTLNFRELISLDREPLTAESPPAVRINSNDDTLGAVDLVSLAAAVKLTPRLALGASFNLWRGEWTEHEDASETPLPGPGETLFLSNHAVNRIRGENFSLGLMLTYPRWSAGFLYQTPLRGNFQTEGTVNASGMPSTSTPLVDGTLWFPRAVGVGGAWRPATRWTVALDLTWDEWKDAEVETAATGRISIFDGLPAGRSATRNTLSVNAGAERLFVAEGFVIPLRFGAAWEPQGGRSPYTLDSVEYKMLALGTGYNTNSLKIDAAFQYRWTRFQDGANFGLALLGEQSLPLAVGERENREWRLKLSLILRVTDTDKLHRTLGRVFGGG